MTLSLAGHTFAPRIRVNGEPLSDLAQGRLVGVVVDSTLFGPASFELRFHDLGEEVLSERVVSVGDAVTIEVTAAGPGGSDVTGTLVTGEVVALEVETDEGAMTRVVRGLDRLHRTKAARKYRSFVRASVADVVRTVASEAGLEVDVVEGPGTTSPLDCVLQAGITDWDLLVNLAARTGASVYLSRGRLCFTSRPKSPGPAIHLAVGAEILRGRFAVSGAGQVPSVAVRGWDPARRQSVEGTATPDRPSASGPATPGALASALSSDGQDLVGWPTLVTAAEAEAAASSEAGRIGAESVDVDADVMGLPSLLAGAEVAISKAGAAFDGTYQLSGARHRWDPLGGYVTEIRVAGPRDREPTLGAGGDPSFLRSQWPALPGCLPATVTNVKDPDGEGRIQVAFPWWDGSVAVWARSVQLGAGPDYGFVVLPEVGTEVLVAPALGDPSQFFVLGGLYDGVAKHGLSGVVGSSGEVTCRRISSRTKQTILLADGPNPQGIFLSTGDGTYKLSLDQAKTTITIDAGSGKVRIQAAQIELAASSTLELSGAQVTLKANEKLALNGGLELSIEGVQAKLAASGILQLQGSMIQLNG